MERQGLISNVQRYSLDDGPGIRTTVFFVGCNLNCKWCSNPELISPHQKEMVFEIDGKKQVETVGRKYSVSQLVHEIRKDEVFYHETGGGVTFSGGEPCFQSDYLLEVLKEMKKINIKTAVDTAGSVNSNIFKEIVKHTDTVLLDLKHMDSDKHYEGVGVGNTLILNNGKLIKEQDVNLIVRLVVIPGFNDSYKEIVDRIDYAQEIGADRIDLLRYHEFGLGKYKALKIEYRQDRNLKIDEESLALAYEYGQNKNLNIHIK